MRVCVSLSLLLSTMLAVSQILSHNCVACACVSACPCVCVCVCHCYFLFVLYIGCIIHMCCVGKQMNTRLFMSLLSRQWLTWLPSLLASTGTDVASNNPSNNVDDTDAEKIISNFYDKRSYCISKAEHAKLSWQTVTTTTATTTTKRRRDLPLETFISICQWDNLSRSFSVFWYSCQ